MLQQHVPFSSLGNAQKLASKEKACSSTNVEGQHDQLGGVASFGYSKVHQCKDIPTTSLLLINDSKKAEGQPKCPSPIIPEIAPTTYCNVLKGDIYGSNMEGWNLHGRTRVVVLSDGDLSLRSNTFWVIKR
ncbi:hypothetical protein LWI28_015618 [Acer negundo]|uniref:Uncharacterized protein n=1 Tax=Acer negundo TaxID=4023 RepID=A0AAD5NNG5_ACENE|nr:hypothetical protein LWI28_015618 [Acer negundo]